MHDLCKAGAEPYAGVIPNAKNAWKQALIRRAGWVSSVFVVASTVGVRKYEKLGLSAVGAGAVAPISGAPIMAIVPRRHSRVLGFISGPAGE